MLILLALGLLPVPRVRVELSRRGLLGSAAAAAFTPLAAFADRGKDIYQSDGQVLSGGGAMNEDLGQSVPVFDEDGKIVNIKGYEEEVTKRAIKAGAASVQVPKLWVQADNGAWADPITGRVASSVAMSSQPSSLESIADAGKPENLQLVKVLGLNEELQRADMVAAAKEKRDGVVYYSFDLALPALKCDDTMATVCLPSKVVLISCAVREGALHVLQIDASPDEWRRAGRSIKELRSTFAVDGA